MQTIRAPRALAEMYKAEDPNTMVTETLIRRLMDAGELPVIKNGVKSLSSKEAMDSYLEAKLGGGANVRE